MIRRMLPLAALFLAAPVVAQPGITYSATPLTRCTALKASAGVKKGQQIACPADAPKAMLVAVTSPVIAAAPTAAPKLAIGMNLAPVAPYSAQHPFLDRAKQMQWVDAGWAPVSASLVDATGFPSKPGTVYNSSTALEAGSYVLLYAGSQATSVYQTSPGRNTLTWGGSVSNVDYSTPGRIAFTTTGGAAWQISDLDPAAPIRDFHILRADQEAAWRAGGVINPEWLAKFGKHFSPYRMMDWGLTNGSTLAHWADRPKPTDASWMAVPVETMIALANASDADLWLNLPHLADDDYVRQLATLVRDTLTPAHKLHLEYSNEVWNGQFDQSKWAQAQANTLWGNGQPVGWGNEVFYGYRSAQVMAIAKGVLGDRLSGVLATWPGWGDTQVDDAIASGVARAGKGAIGTLFREYAVTTYFGNQLSFTIGNEPDRPISLAWAQGGAAGLTAAFAEIEHGGTMTSDDSLDLVKKLYARHAAQAKAWGLDLVAYEGGLHIFNYMAPESEKPARMDLLNRMIADPRMGTLYARMAEDFRAASGTVLADFNDVGAPGIFGAFGVIPDLTATSPRYEALRAASGR